MVKCDICGSACDDEYIDGRTKMGPWGIMCPRCHKRVGVGLGTGKGQLYGNARPKGMTDKEEAALREEAKPFDHTPVSGFQKPVEDSCE